MNNTFSGADARQPNRSGTSRSNHGYVDHNANMPGILSTLELRRLVAAMVD
ncbi:hypothetical protein [Aurantiacibacter odishensis]|uniref:hypothetical protein n=1 Tax=Aurantiacibacter odishensis TaxID=1155476 RepID=UPI0013C4B7C1|nr:hypothetical protein [Aurantiacibacter odishensis]